MKMPNNVLKVIKKIELVFTKDRAKTLICMNAVGVVVTAGVSIRAGMDIQKKIDEGNLTKKDIAKNVAKVASSVVLTEVAGICSYNTSAKTIAAQAVELVTAKREYNALENKIRESVGNEKADDIVKEANKEASDKTIEDDKLIADADGYYWFKDTFSNACFYTKESEIWKAWNVVVEKVKGLNRDQVSLWDFYYHIRRSNSTGTSSEMIKEYGWDGDDENDLRMGSIDLNGIGATDSGKPCKLIRYFNNEPHYLKDKSKISR